MPELRSFLHVSKKKLKRGTICRNFGGWGGVSCHILSFQHFIFEISNEYQCHMHNNTIFESLYVCKLTSHQISLPQKYKFLCNFKKCNFTQLPYNIQGQKVYA